MTFDFDQFSPRTWMQQGLVVVPKPRKKQKAQPQQAAPWSLAASIISIGVSFAPVVAGNSVTVSIPAESSECVPIFGRREFSTADMSTKWTGDPDYVPMGYWPKMKAYLGGLPERQGSRVEDPDPIL